MARPAEGKVAKASSRTALFAHIAARLAGQPRRDDSAYFKTRLRVNVSEKAGRVAADAVRSSLAKWMLVSEGDLDLDVSLLRFEPGGRAPEEIVEVLKGISGIRQVLQLGTSGEVLAVAVFDGARARRELRAMIQERLGTRPRWDEVESETFAPAARTWRDLARKAAHDEDLVVAEAEALTERT
jgi:hypothetical protein